MNKLAEIRAHGYDISMLPSGELDIDLPEGVELTPKLTSRLAEIKPMLIADLKAEQSLQGGSYRFTDYMTRKDKRGNGRLVIEFANNGTGEIIEAYFNVNITYQRGVNNGAYFKTGYRGRFWVLPRSKFAAFWIAAIGQPEKWSTVYRQMNRLKGLEFVGNEKQSATYKQLIDIRALRKCM